MQWPALGRAQMVRREGWVQPLIISPLRVQRGHCIQVSPSSPGIVHRLGHNIVMRAALRPNAKASACRQISPRTFNSLAKACS